MLEQKEVQYDQSVMNGTKGKITPNPGVRFKKVPIKFDVETLDSLLAYAYTENSAFLTRAALINLNSLIDMINMNKYKNNQQMKARIDYLKLLLEARLEVGLDNKKLMANYALDKCEYPELMREEILPEINKLKLNSRAIQYLNGFIADKLSYAFMFAYKDEMFRIYEDMESGNYQTMKELTMTFEALLTDLLYDIRNTKNISDETLFMDLSDGSFEQVVESAVKKLKDPSNKLITGSQALNILLNGGFEAGRSYLIFGLTGIGKSVVLLNILVWLKKYNKVKARKDPSKRPAILFITQENSVTETIERLFNMLITGDDIRDYTPSEVIRLLREKGELTLKTDTDVDILIRYYDDKSISTTDLYSVIDDIEDTGREVIALIHDYIERIRSSRNHTELRLELAEVANDYSVLAKRLNIPVIGAGQLNRKGSDAIDIAMEANKSDLVRMLGKGAVSESYGMLKNLDTVIFIHREMDEDGNEYYTFLDNKSRSKKRKKGGSEWSNYLAHPLDPENGIKLLDDLHLEKPLSKRSLREELSDTSVSKKNKSLREVQKFNPLNKKDEETETIEDEFNMLDFKFLEKDSLKARKIMKFKESDEGAIETQFNETLAKHTDSFYGRDDNGYIKLFFKEEFEKRIG